MRRKEQAQAGALQNGKLELIGSRRGVGGKMLALAATLVALFSLWGGAQFNSGKALAASASQQQSKAALGQMLNADGTLNTPAGFNGAVDAKGWRMTPGQDGKPHFTPASPTGPQVAGDEKWDSRFPTNELAGPVAALAVSGSVIYAAQSATIMQYTGTKWISIGAVNGAAQSMAVLNGALYVGGAFSSVSGVAANNIARWNGATWSGVDGGVGGSVLAMAVSGNNLYVGGSFVTAGGAEADNVAVYNGSYWSGVDGGVSDVVYALAVSGANLYVGGGFSSAGGQAVSNLAVYNGSFWSGIDGGTDSTIYAIAVDGANVFVGGVFTHAGGSAANHIAKYNGSFWSPLGGGLDNDVYALAYYDNALYAGGAFQLYQDADGGQGSANYFSYWDGANWHLPSYGANDKVRAILNDNGRLIIGGDFLRASGVDSPFVITYSNNDGGFVALNIVSSGPQGEVYALAVSGANLYVGGAFTQVNGVAANYIAKWDGSTWSALGNGLDKPVDTLAVSGADLYVGGAFTVAGGVQVNRIAKWNGVAWSALGGGMDDEVYALAASGSTIYAGGAFAHAGGAAASFIAKWNGSAWSALGGGLDNAVYALAANGNTLYAGGLFDKAGALAVNGVAQWNGSAWSALGSGLDVNNGEVYALAVSGANLYVGGYFNNAGGVAAKNIAKWNGSTWSALGSGLDNEVYALTISNNNLYAGGGGFATGGGAYTGIVMWNGSAWSALGSGIDGSVYTLAATASAVYAGGEFGRAGGHSSSNFAIWYPNGMPTATATATATRTPGGATATASATRTATASATRTNTTGTATATRTNTIGSPTATRTPINFSDVHPNDYFYTPVQFLAASGAISGYSDNTFRPFNNTTRGQMVKIIVVAEGFSLVTPAQPSFSDVPVGSAFYSFVETAVAKQIVSGYSDGTFRPNANVTRGQLSKIVALAANWSLISPATATFRDVSPSNPFYGFVETAASKGIISGYSCGASCLEFRPGANAIRGQIAKIVYLALQAR